MCAALSAFSAFGLFRVMSVTPGLGLETRTFAYSRWAWKLVEKERALLLTRQNVKRENARNDIAICGGR